MSFGDEIDFNSTRANFDVHPDIDADIADTTQVTTIPCTTEITSEQKTSSPQALSILAKNVTSIQNPPNDPPNPSYFTDTHLVNEVKHGEKSEDKEMLPFDRHY